MRDEDKTREELLTDVQRIRMHMAGMAEAEAFRRRAERDLEQMTRIAAALVKSSPCGLLVLQRHLPERLVLVHANSQATRLLHIAVDGRLGSDLERVWPGSAMQALKRDLIASLDTGKPFEASGVTYEIDSLRRSFNISAFRLPEDRLGLYLAEAAEHHAPLPATAANESADATTDAHSTHESSFGQNGREDGRTESRQEEIDSQGNHELAGRAEDLSRQVRKLSAQLQAAREDLAREVELREAAEEAVTQVWRELEARVEERTREMFVAREAVERALAESHAQEELLRTAQYQLEERARKQENEIRELAETLEIEIEEHKKTEERLDIARIALESRMTEADDDLAAANELLREQVAERKRIEGELRLSLVERELAIHELKMQLSEMVTRSGTDTASGTSPNASVLTLQPALAPLQHVGLGYLSLDVDGVVTSFNGKLLEIFGLPAENDLRGINLFDSSMVLEAGLMDTAQECLRSRAASTHEGPFQDASGGHRMARVHFAPLVNHAGDAIGCEAIFEDVSEDRLKQGQCFRSQREHALSRTVARVGDKVDDMVQSVSEHARTALARVESDSFPDLAVELEAILTKSRDAGRMARRMRQFGRMRPRIETRQPRVFDLTDVVKETLAMDAPWSKPSMTEDGPSFAVDPSLHHGCLIQGVDEDFIELMANLLDNAVEALTPGGRITVSTRLDNGEVVLEVRDNGTGMSDRQVTELFEPFYTTKQGHTGLGLCVVLGIVRSHGGTLDVVSNMQRGSTFTVRLPYSSPPSGEESRIGDEPVPGNYRILFVYHPDSAARIEDTTLTRLGYAIFTARSVEEAVKVLKRTRIDAIVCDGVEEASDSADVSTALELLSRQMGLHKPPVIVLAESSGLAPQCRRGTCSSLDLIVEKPVGLSRLIDIIAREIRDADANFPRLNWPNGGSSLPLN